MKKKKDFYTVNVEVTVEGNSEDDARNRAICFISTMPGAVSGGMTDDDLERKGII